MWYIIYPIYLFRSISGLHQCFTHLNGKELSFKLMQSSQDELCEPSLLEKKKRCNHTIYLSEPYAARNKNDEATRLNRKWRIMQTRLYAPAYRNQRNLNVYIYLLFVISSKNKFSSTQQYLIMSATKWKPIHQALICYAITLAWHESWRLKQRQLCGLLRIIFRLATKNTKALHQWIFVEKINPVMPQSVSMIGS